MIVYYIDHDGRDYRHMSFEENKLYYMYLDLMGIMQRRGLHPKEYPLITQPLIMAAIERCSTDDVPDLGFEVLAGIDLGEWIRQWVCDEIDSTYGKNPRSRYGELACRYDDREKREFQLFLETHRTTSHQYTIFDVMQED